MRPSSPGSQPMPASCDQPKRSPLGRSRSISSVKGSRPAGPAALVFTRSKSSPPPRRSRPARPLSRLVSMRALYHNPSGPGGPDAVSRSNPRPPPGLGHSKWLRSPLTPDCCWIPGCRSSTTSAGTSSARTPSRSRVGWSGPGSPAATAGTGTERGSSKRRPTSARRTGRHTRGEGGGLHGSSRCTWTAGHLYVFLVYGMHFCANVVTGCQGVAEAVLLRAAGVPDGCPPKLLSGPGRLCARLGITARLSGLDLLGGGAVRVLGGPTPAPRLAVTPRIGIDYAGEAREWPLRFVDRDSPCVSGPKRFVATP